MKHSIRTIVSYSFVMFLYSDDYDLVIYLLKNDNNHVDLCKICDGESKN